MPLGEPQTSSALPPRIMHHRDRSILDDMVTDTLQSPAKIHVLIVEIKLLIESPNLANASRRIRRNMPANQSGLIKLAVLSEYVPSGPPKALAARLKTVGKRRALSSVAPSGPIILGAVSATDWSSKERCNDGKGFP